MVFAAAEPERDQLNASPPTSTGSKRAQIKPGDRSPGPARGPTPSSKRTQPGDNSNTQYALLGLNAATEVGRAGQARGLGPRASLLGTQPEARRELGLHARLGACLDRQHDLRGDLEPDHHRAEAVPGAGVPRGRDDPELRQGGHQSQPPARDRLDGQPLPGRPEFRQRPAVEALLPLRPGACRPAGRACASSASTTGTAWGPRSSSTSRTSSRASGKGRWSRATRSVATSFALLFLAKGRAPVLVNKLRHGPRGDWNNDPDDVRNLVAVVSRDWKTLLTWQVVDPAVASVADLLQAPDRLPQRPQGPRARRRRPARTSATTSSRGASSSPTPAAPASEFDARLPRADEGALPRGGVQAPAPLRGPPGLAGQAPPDARRLPALGHRARLPHGGDLLAQGPLLLLEPGRTLARPTRPSSWPPGSARTSSTTPPAGSSPPTSSSSARCTTSGPTPPSGAPCGSPSSATPATGTSPPWPSPT